MDPPLVAESAPREWGIVLEFRQRRNRVIAPPPDFDLRAYAERSFGVFQEEPQEIEWCFAPSGNAELLCAMCEEVLRPITDRIYPGDPSARTERNFGRRVNMLQWLRRRRQAARLAQADAEALIHDHGAAAYREARERERDVILPDGTTHAGRTPAHWRRVALVVAKRTGRKGRAGYRE